jgi:hypothetical protein
MPRQRVNFRKVLPAGFVAVHSTAAGRKDASRWMIYNPEDVFVGDLVRFHERTGDVWSWQPYPEGHYRDGTLDECCAEIAKLAKPFD